MLTPRTQNVPSFASFPTTILNCSRVILVEGEYWGSKSHSQEGHLHLRQPGAHQSHHGVEIYSISQPLPVWKMRQNATFFGWNILEDWVFQNDWSIRSVVGNIHSENHEIGRLDCKITYAPLETYRPFRKLCRIDRRIIDRRAHREVSLSKKQSVCTVYAH